MQEETIGSIRLLADSDSKMNFANSESLDHYRTLAESPLSRWPSQGPTAEEMVV